MSNSRLLKIIAYKSEVLSLEEQEYEERNLQYVEEFNKDFHLELSYAHETEMKDDKNNVESKLKMPNESLKKIHRKLALATHPDKNLDKDTSEDFKEIQEAYEQGDGPTLIGKLLDYDLDIELSEIELRDIQKQLDMRTGLLEQKKQTCAWVWHNSSKDDNPGLRLQIRQSMGIDEALFQAWLKTR
tara:strand:- start:5641 stop:6198 length:558 start_codon:yes stop_codon:yes gene_type:complete